MARSGRRSACPATRCRSPNDAPRAAGTRRAASPEHAQRAVRRGVAVLHEVGLDDRLPVRARPRAPPGARREQAAAADGQADRVLHEAGELVLDPFAGVGGTLLGAAIARRRGGRSGSSCRRAGRTSTRASSTRPRAERDGPARSSSTSARTIRAARGASTRPAASCVVGDALAVLPTLAAESVDFVATDPPYNIQLPMTMSGGALAESFANRRTDYAMVTDDPADLANSADYPAFLDRMTEVLARAGARPAARPLRRADRPRCLPGRALRVHRR